MSDVVIFGTGQISELAHFYLTNDSEHRIVGFTKDEAYCDEDSYKNLPVVSFEALEQYFPPDRTKLFIPISFKGVNKVRMERFGEAKKRGYQFVSYISSKATYYDTPVGENCFIFENNTIQPFTKIGDNVVMWSGNHLGHHSTIGDHCFITSHVVISGAVTVGEQSFMGVNATVRDNISIGKACVIGAGATVTKSLEDGAVIKAPKSVVCPFKSDSLKGI